MSSLRMNEDLVTRICSRPSPSTQGPSAAQGSSSASGQGASHADDLDFSSDSELLDAVELLVASAPSASNSASASRPQDTDSNSDASFERYIEEAKRNGVQKKISRKKQAANRVKLQAAAAKRTSRLRERSRSSSESNNSETEFDAFIRSLGTLSSASHGGSKRSQPSRSSHQNQTKRKREYDTELPTRPPPPAAHSRSPLPSTSTSQDNPLDRHCRRGSRHKADEAEGVSQPSRKGKHQRRSAPSVASASAQGIRRSSSMRSSTITRPDASTFQHSSSIPIPPTRSRAAPASVEVIDIDSDCGLGLSPRAVAESQVAEDEAFARALQEEMDREFAASLVDHSSPVPQNVTAVYRMPSAGQVVPSSPSMPSNSTLRNPTSTHRFHSAASRRRRSHGRRLEDEEDDNAATVEPAAFGFGSAASPVRAGTSSRHRSPYRRANAGQRRWPSPDFLALDQLLAPESSGRRRGRGRYRADWNVNPFPLPSTVTEILSHISRDTLTYEDQLALGDELGDVVKKGLTDAQLERLPTKLYHVSSASNQKPSNENQEECNICFCEYVEKDVIKILTCFHEFHNHCINKWLKNNSTCPICRVEIQLQ